jgi:hypothetical protein
MSAHASLVTTYCTRIDTVKESRTNQRGTHTDDHGEFHVISRKDVFMSNSEPRAAGKAPLRHHPALAMWGSRWQWARAPHLSWLWA